MIALTFDPARDLPQFWIAYQPDGTRAGHVMRSRNKDPQYAWEAHMCQPLTGITRSAGFGATPDEAKRLLVRSFAFHHCDQSPA